MAIINKPHKIAIAVQDICCNLEAKCKISVFQLECTSSCISNASLAIVAAHRERRQPCSHSLTISKKRAAAHYTFKSADAAREPARVAYAPVGPSLCWPVNGCCLHTHTLILGSLAHEHKFRMQNARRWPKRARSSQPASQPAPLGNKYKNQSVNRCRRASFLLLK